MRALSLSVKGTVPLRGEIFPILSAKVAKGKARSGYQLPPSKLAPRFFVLYLN